MDAAAAGLAARVREAGTGGAFVAVVGPSGAGKDTLIAHARVRLAGHRRPAVHFVRRVVTRVADAGAEDHDSLTPEEFAAAERAGAFALAWSAHGLSYGIPAAVDARIAAGEIAVANLSRGAVPALMRRYRNVAVVLVTASPEVLAARLAARGRESRAEVLARLARADDASLGAFAATVTVRNDGTPEEGGEALVAAILAAGGAAG